MIQNAGSQLLAADGAVGTSGTAVRVFMMHIISGGTPAVVSLRSGTSTAGTIRVTETGTANTGATFTYGMQGLLFPSGCFLDLDGNTTSVLVTFNHNS